MSSEKEKFFSAMRYSCFNSRFWSGGVLTLNRFFCGLQRNAEVTGNFVRCLQLSKLKLGLELKQKFTAQFLFLNNSNPSLQMRTNIFFHDCGICGVGVARLPVCGILVLTHNFEMRKPEKARLPLFSICGLWLPWWQWQNCKSKQAVCLELKQKFIAKFLFLNNSNPALLVWKNTFFHDCEICGVGLARLPVCGILVLTHNFEMRRPENTRLPVFWVCGLWFLWW